MTKCDHRGGELLKTIVIIASYDGMGTELTLKHCDYCKNFVVKLLSHDYGRDVTVRTLETGGWSTKK